MLPRKWKIRTLTHCWWKFKMVQHYWKYDGTFSKKIKNGTTMKVTQLCPTLCDPMDCSPSGSSGAGYWSELYLPDWGIKPRSPALQADFTDWSTRKPMSSNLTYVYLSQIIEIGISKRYLHLHVYCIVIHNS